MDLILAPVFYSDASRLLCSLLCNYDYLGLNTSELRRNLHWQDRHNAKNGYADCAPSSPFVATPAVRAARGGAGDVLQLLTRLRVDILQNCTLFAARASSLTLAIVRSIRLCAP